MNKNLGQVFTRDREIDKMLKMIESNFPNLKILEPSFGDGNFLVKIVKTFILKCRSIGLSDIDIMDRMDEKIFGVELDKSHYEKAISRLDELLIELNFEYEYDWDNLKNMSIFDYTTEYDFDVIIGNPPYVRIHNFDKSTKDVNSSLKLTSGNSDLYLMFIDYLLNLLSFNGNMVFIVPNSLGKSKSAQNIRDYMFANGSVSYIDYESEQLFDNVSVYVAIFHYKNNVKNENIFVSSDGTVYDMDDKYFLPKSLSVFTEDLEIKNGVATLCDNVFIFESYPKNMEKDFIKRIYKGSKPDKEFWIIFPYKIVNGKIVKFGNSEELKKIAPNIYNHLTKHKNVLEKRSMEKRGKWYEYGRSQAINDIMVDKYLIDTLIRPNATSLNIKHIGKGSLVFSGLYALNDNIVKINDEQLISYLRFRSKDIRGGYKKLSSNLFKFKK